jgi:uncharacterized membrane protein (DUF373 family)
METSFEYDISRLLYLHQISKKDGERLKWLGQFFKDDKGEFLNLVVEVLYKFPELREQIDEKFVERFKKEFSTWYDRLFSGKYDAAYMHYLMNLGETFFHLGFSPHHIIVFMDFIRNFFNTKLIEKIKGAENEETVERLRLALKSLNKVLDLNLDVIISHFVDVETKKLFMLGKFGKLILSVAQRFGLILDSSILAGLVLLAFFIVYLFINDILHIFGGNMAHGVVAALGDLLILWTILELLNSQIKFMLGGEFAISSFVSVALAATIREALIASLEPTKSVEFKVTLALIIFVLGLVFGIVKWFEIKGMKKGALT